MHRCAVSALGIQSQIGQALIDNAKHIGHHVGSALSRRAVIPQEAGHIEGRITVGQVVIADGIQRIGVGREAHRIDALHRVLRPIVIGRRAAALVVRGIHHNGDDLLLIVLIHIFDGVTGVIGSCHQLGHIAVFNRIGREDIDRAGNTPAHDQLLGGGAVQLAVDHRVDHITVARNGAVLCVAALAVRLENADLQRMLLTGGVPQEGQRLIYAVAVQILQLNGLGMGAGDRRSILIAHIQQGFQAGLKAFILRRRVGQGVKLLRCAQSAAGQCHCQCRRQQPQQDPLSHRAPPPFACK